VSTLLLDIGNSRLKWAQPGKGRQRLRSHGEAPRPAPEELPDLARKAWGRLRPRRVLAACVAGPAFAEALAAWCREAWDLEPELVQAPGRGWGVTNAYRRPERLGPDRWAALVAAWRRTQEPVCVVDAGTALTIDALDAAGRHLGGLIVPGPELMRRALLQGTGALQALAADPEPADGAALLARDTAPAIEGGALYALVALVARVPRDLEAELGRPLRRLLTGGDAPRLLPLLSDGYDHAPHLVLEGLAVMAEEAP